MFLGSYYNFLQYNKLSSSEVKPVSFKGDVLLRVNDTDLHNATHQQAAFALKSIIPNSYVRLHLHYRPRGVLLQ